MNRFARILSSLCLAFTSYAADWPQFRGPTGQGISTEKNLPETWSADSNVLWKIQIPGDACWSSPITHAGRVYLTYTTDAGAACHIVCYDAKDGHIVWNHRLFDQIPRRKENKNSYATPTPVTDGERLFAVFGDGSVVAVSLNDPLKILWADRSTDFYSRHGLGASPIVHDGLVIMPYDGSNRVTQSGTYPKITDEEKLGWQIPWDRSYVRALDARTGKEVWRTPRGKSRIAHLSPLVHAADGRNQIISCAGDAIQGFDSKTGAKLWTAYSQGEGVTPNPVLAENLVITSSGFEKTTLRAVRLGGQGDVTASHIAWEQRKGCPTQPSLLYVKPYLHTITDGGIAHCYKADTGDLIYAERIGGNFCASPVYADGRIYFLAEDGATTVISAGPEFKVLAKNSLNGERTQASMAVSNGKFFIRTERTLWCIGK